LEDGTDNACHLHKRLNGLKQAPRVWNKLLIGFHLSHGFVQSRSDAAIFFLRQPGKATLFLLMYVDDLQIACAALQRVTEVKHLILSHFLGTDLGASSFSCRCLFAGIVLLAPLSFVNSVISMR
jgi:hypothetical protein